MNTRFPATTKGISKHCFVFENHSKVLFNIVSEASYVHILSQQKFLKNALNGQFWRGFKNLKLSVKQRYQTDHFELDKNWWKLPKYKY